MDRDHVDLEQVRVGLQVELEHETSDPEANETDDAPRLPGKIAVAHVTEFPDYYTRLAQVEAEAEIYPVKTTGKS